MYLVYTSNPSEEKSNFSKGCPEGAARGTTQGKVRLSRAWVGSITFFFIDNFTESEGFYILSPAEGDGIYRLSLAEGDSLEKPSLRASDGLEKPSTSVSDSL